MAKDQKEIPLAAVAFTNLLHAGDSKLKAVKNAGAVSTTICCLAIAARKLEHWPTQAEYADYWHISERKAQIEWALFRRAFPSEQSPDNIARRILTDLHGRVEAENAPLTVPAPDFILAAA